ncbi:MAG: tRNA pseudouridine(55) synthase TruB [Acidobacteriota bacterium]|nr:tRNA pseudouridine(55) synthase TruB [Acidobacteriota bacterium]
MNGLVLIDKPGGCTSHDVVNRWRRLANTKRVGHLGTLDPMATGLLAIVTGNATRLAQYFGHDEKTYVAEITFGIVSDTYDIEGVVQETGNVAPSDPATIVSAFARYRGRFFQTPPAVSAKKINGVPAYKLARKNVAVELKPVEVEIKRLDVQKVSGNHVRVLVTCSSGTYIRSLAHDVGRDLGCGAVLSRLRRTGIGDLNVDLARCLDELTELAASGRLAEAVIPAARLLPKFPSEYFDIVIETQIRQGRDFRTSPFVVRPGAPYVKALSSAGELIAIGELRIPNVYHPGTVL